MSPIVDYVLVGTGVAPLFAAQRILNRGERVAVLNPDTDFFLEGSELPLDLLHFKAMDANMQSRFANNLSEQIYRDLIQEYPGALEIWKPEISEIGSSQKNFQVSSAPWIRQRNRVWVAPSGSESASKVESLYLQALEMNWKPKWLEGVSLAKRFPGFSTHKLTGRISEKWIGFVGPRLGDVDVERYREGLLEVVQERLVHHSETKLLLTQASVLEVDQRGVRYQLPTGSPQNIEVVKKVIFFWTPKLEKMIKGLLEKNAPRLFAGLDQTFSKKYWEEWEILSRENLDPSVVGHYESIRIWASGEGAPTSEGWKTLKILRRVADTDRFNSQSFKEVSSIILQFLGWSHYTVRNLKTRVFYRWKDESLLQWSTGRSQVLVMRSCDGPLHWIAQQVRKVVDPS